MQYYTQEEMLRQVPAMINPSHATLIVVLAPTSKLTTNFKMFEYAKELADKISNGRVAVVQHCGPRIDLAASMINKGTMEMCPREFTGGPRSAGGASEIDHLKTDSA